MTKLRVVLRDGSEATWEVEESGGLRLHYRQARRLDEWSPGEEGESTLSLLSLARIEVLDAPEAAAHSGIGTEAAVRMREQAAEREQAAKEAEHARRVAESEESFRRNREAMEAAEPKPTKAAKR